MVHSLFIVKSEIQRLVVLLHIMPYRNNVHTVSLWSNKSQTFTTLDKLHYTTGEYKFSKKSSSHLKTVEASRVLRRKFHTEDPQILGAIT